MYRRSSANAAFVPPTVLCTALAQTEAGFVGGAAGLHLGLGQAVGNKPSPRHALGEVC